jgi:hypothetical protein
MHTSPTGHHARSFGVLVFLVALAVWPTGQASAQLWNALSTVPSPNISVGLIAGETLRLCLSLPEQSRRSDRLAAALNFRFVVHDTVGDVIAQSDELTVRESQTQCWDVARTALLRTGEPVTGRLQARAKIEVVVTKPLHPVHVVASAEILNSSTGETKFGYQLQGYEVQG